MAEKTGKDICKACWFWFLQISLWGALVFLIVGLASGKKDLSTPSIVTFSIVWFLYFVCNLCSSTCSYLNNQQQNSTIHGYMLDLFKQRPRLMFHVTCYHYETRHHTTRDKDGNVRHHTDRVRVNTWSESREFHYLSSRDCSGLFRLDAEAIKDNPGKYFIKLHLKHDIRKSDDGTAMEYASQRDRFYMMNRWRDQHMDTSETTTIPGYNEYNLVSLGSENPNCIGLGYFIIFTILGVVQFYKKFVDSYCIKQEYTIVKEISYFRNLNALEFHSAFNSYNPQIVLKEQVLLHFNDPSQLPVIAVPPCDLPTLDELNRKQQSMGGDMGQGNFQGQGVQPGLQHDPYAMAPQTNAVPQGGYPMTGQSANVQIGYNNQGANQSYGMTVQTNAVAYNQSTHVDVTERDIKDEPLMRKDH